MRKKNMVLTVLVTVAVLCVGVFLPGWLDEMFFDADDATKEEWSMEAELKEDRETFMEHFFFPLFETSEPMSMEEQMYFQADSNGISGEIYRRLSDTVDVSFEDTAWEIPAFAGSQKYVILQSKTAENKEGYRLHLAVTNTMIPVLFWRENLTLPTEEQQQAAWKKLGQYAAGQGQELSDYIEKIDGIYGDTWKYRQDLNGIYENFHDRGNEISGEVSLWACCENGEWQVYTNKTQNILVCVLKEHSVILYYDAVGEQFCGYSIVPLGDIP